MKAEHAHHAEALLDDDVEKPSSRKRERALVYAVLAVAEALSTSPPRSDDTGPAEAAALDLAPGFIDTRHNWGDDEWRRRRQRHTA